jgi:hypothetical protein
MNNYKKFNNSNLIESFDKLNQLPTRINQKDDFSSKSNIFIINTNNNNIEIIKYLNENSIISKIHPLEYWAKNAYKYPILSILTRQYLAISATSASIESIFNLFLILVIILLLNLKIDSIQKLLKRLFY